MFDDLSDASRDLRFRAATPRLTRTALRHLATVLPCERGSVVAMIGTRAVGIAQWAKYADEPRVAELTVAVADRYQRRGLGGALVGAAATGIARAGGTHVAATVHPENRTVLGWLRDAGAGPRAGYPGELLVDAAALARRMDEGRDRIRA